MASLKAAHRGYEYQDILVAGRLVDMLLGSLLHVDVDEKLVPDDRFDDLTTVDVVGNRERTQFKHTDNDGRPLTLSTFTSDSRGLRLDRVIAAMLADHAGPGSKANETIFRIILRDAPPIDPGLTAVLMSPKRDPGPFLPAMGTLRLGFDAVALWQQRKDTANKGEPFSLLFRGKTPLTFDELEWACQHLVVEVDAPPASKDLTAPDVAERLLLTRVREEVGAEAYPNADRTVIDVAVAIVSTARAARQGIVVPTAEKLLQSAQLRSDFGSVSRAHPVDRAVEVLRPSTVGRLVDAATELAIGGGYLLVVGPPGHGKSWVCQQLFEALFDAGWLIAEHYCYLGDADGERNERVLADAIFGTLVGRLAEADPRLVTDLRPRFAADEDALIRCIRRSLQMEPNRRIALVIDGIDHITRLCARSGGRFDPSRGLTETLSSLDLPPDTVVIVLSQPGAHLDPLEHAGAKTVTVPGLDEPELKSLASRLNVVRGVQRNSPATESPLLEDDEAIASFLNALVERSGGNALYATYLCREMLRAADTFVDPATAVRSLPPFDGTLKNYYDHLYRVLGAEAGWVADVIALVDFGITRAELRQIRPDAAHRVDGALAVLKPVLIERATQGGVRVYHESFARYLRGPFQHDTVALQALLEHIVNWLEDKGLFVDPRAFRSLLAILAEAGHDQRVVELVDRAFVTRAVAAGFPSSIINANLATAIGSAARLGDWAAVVRYVELARAAESYQSERFDSTLVSFADVPASILGADTVAARLVDDDRLVMPARAGLQMCAAVDALGATAPWRAYMTGYIREAKTDNTSYGEVSDRAVALAWLRGRLRLASLCHGIDSQEHSALGEVGAEVRVSDGEERGEQWHITAPIDWSRLAERVEKLRLPVREVISAVADTHGFEGVIRLVRSLRSPGDACLALAERLASGPVSGNGIGSPREWATEAATHGITAGSMYRLLRLGVDPAHLAHDTITVARDQLLDLTRKVQLPSVRWEGEHVGAWLDACVLASHRDQLGINAAEALIGGDGWYRCWLRFAIAFSRAEAAEPALRGSIALEALRILTDDLNPFSGAPRSCDLYSLHDAIRDTIARAMQLLDDEQWEEGLAVLKEVSASITTTLSGELGGPVPPDFLLRLAVSGASPTRLRAAETLIQDEITRGSARRYYADLAEYRLQGARLALAFGDRARAEILWNEACAFLTAYGWHKDITIYEVLDPLPVLIKIDPARGRVRVANAQGVCERVPLHTDGRETRHAWSRWWGLLAKADPVAAIHISVPQLLSKCNNPNWLLNGALEDVWQEWHEQVDPVVAGVVRLTLDTPLYPEDVRHLKRLAKYAETDGEVARRLMMWLFARADERPVAYSDTNSAELIAKDDQVVAELNAIAGSVNLPFVVAVREGRTTGTVSTSSMDTSRRSESSLAEAYKVAYTALPSGLPGLLRAIRFWRRRPFDAKSTEWAVERFANAIGYRLIELTADGRQDEASSALRSLAEGSDFGERSGILRSVAEGLERYGEARLSALAYALAWTRTRGHGGWLRFGGETEIEALRAASKLDSSVACSVLAEEIQRVVAASYGSHGISQAVIYAFAVGALNCAIGSASDMAFAAWDEALSVISARAPRVDASDDPEHPYIPPDLDGGEAAPGDLEAALALAAFGALAHPGREKKRRALLAAEFLLAERTALTVSAFDIALRTISDPATLTWLLRLIDSSGQTSLPVQAACQKTLSGLASRDLITVRALARRLGMGDEFFLAPPTPADGALLAAGNKVLRIPNGVYRLSADEVALDEYLESIAGVRLRRAERLLPGLREAVRARVATALQDTGVKDRLKSQLDAFADRLRERFPDAFLADEETIERIIQSIAAGGRTARLMSGQPISNPIAWEDELASVLLIDPTIPLSLEAQRQPRPPIALPPGSGHEAWARVREHDNGEPVEVTSEEARVLFATLTIEPVNAVPIVERGPFSGWRWLGTVEKRNVRHPDLHRKTDLLAERYHVLEIRDADDCQALTLPPVAAGDLRMWRTQMNSALGMPLLDKSQPLLGIDHELKIMGDSRQGLGAPDALLVPTPILIALLNLSPGMPWTFHDSGGIGLALVIWRAEYDISDYYLALPRTCGSGIVIRPDLFARLVAAAGEHRLALRDFVVGDIELLHTHTASTVSEP